MSLVATGVEFAAFADMNADAWMRISGAALRHAIRGVGSIEAVEPRRNYIPLITVSFGSGDPVRFNSDGFRKGNFPEIEIPDDLEEAFLHWKEEWIKEQERRAADAALRQIEEERTKATRAKLMALATRYNVRITHLLSPVTLETLSRILTKLETGSAFRWETMLSENDLRQLEDKIDLNVQASFYHRQYKETGNLWCLVNTSRDLRYAGIPETAIEITARFPEPGCDSLLAGALLTTRGGALRDLSQHAEARKCATEAAERSPKSFYPHNLLGALAYDEGNYVEGDEHFERAAQLGSRAKDQEREIRKALYKANAAGRSALIEYLLKKDPTKYAWVVIYEILETA